MPRGRPIKSQIRQNIVEILYFMKKGYGYDIYLAYKKIFPVCTLRSIYYHLAKGVKLKELKVKEIKSEKGDFSWGSTAEKVYYELGPEAKPTMNDKVRKYFKK
jgi:hypothetical protein